MDRGIDFLNILSEFFYSFQEPVNWFIFIWFPLKMVKLAETSYLFYSSLTPHFLVLVMGFLVLF